jgi:hypothetical protein
VSGLSELGKEFRIQTILKTGRNNMNGCVTNQLKRDNNKNSKLESLCSTAFSNNWTSAYLKDTFNASNKFRPYY